MNKRTRFGWELDMRVERGEAERGEGAYAASWGRDRADDGLIVDAYFIEGATLVVPHLVPWCR